MKVTDASVPPNAAVLRTLDQTVRGLPTEMVDFTREFVAIASENPPGLEYPAAVRVIEATLRGLGCSACSREAGRDGVSLDVEVRTRHSRWLTGRKEFVQRIASSTAPPSMRAPLRTSSACGVSPKLPSTVSS
jgi:acetylornithine deacetylase/succinyl-diaminopimelate desuccinylase-like protein